MLANFQREYNINKILLSSIGLWPYQNKLIRYLILIPCFASEVSYVLLEILTLFDYWEDMDIVFEVCYQCVATSAIIGQIFNVFWQREKIKRMYKAIDNHWNIFTSKLEVQTLKDYSNITRKLTFAYTVMIYSMTIIFILAPLTPVFLDMIHPLNESRSRLFPLTAKFRIDDEKYYTQLYCYIVSMIVFSILGLAASNSTFLICIIHACSLFSIISQQFEEVIKKLHANKNIRKFGCRMKTKLEFENEQIIYQRYIICLKKYQLALEFVDMLNSAYKIISLITLLLNGAVVTFIGIIIINVLDRVREVMRYTFVAIGILIQLLMLCYSGQKLRDESQNVFYRAYAAEWYKCSPRLKSLLIVTLYRSVAPCSLTAGNMIPLSIETYGFVVRTAGSYFMTFLSLKM
nr:PREDICTED: odorant receptor 67c-like [Linepithema humile]